VIDQPIILLVVMASESMLKSVLYHSYSDALEFISKQNKRLKNIKKEIKVKLQEHNFTKYLFIVATNNQYRATTEFNYPFCNTSEY